MNLKSITIELIRQDLIHHRFIRDLESIGLYYETEMDLCVPIARLMGEEPDGIRDEWLERYFSFMKEVKKGHEGLLARVVWKEMEGM